MNVDATLLSWGRRMLRACSLGFVATIVGAVAVALCLSAAYAQEEQPEYVVKTAFIYNFLKFTQWPNGAFAKPESPIVVCTMGTDPYGSALNVLASKRIDSHPIALERSIPANAVGKCNAIIVSGPNSSQVLVAFEPLKTHPILTIGDGADFAAAGGMIGLVNVDRQVRFQINVGAVRRSSLSISSQLLKIAILVDAAR
jgi:hypothetical protein